MKKILIFFAVLSCLVFIRTKTASATCLTVGVYCDGELVTNTIVCGETAQDRLNELSEAMMAICY